MGSVRTEIRTIRYWKEELASGRMKIMMKYKLPIRFRYVFDEDYLPNIDAWGKNRTDARAKAKRKIPKVVTGIRKRAAARIGEAWQAIRVREAEVKKIVDDWEIEKHNKVALINDHQDTIDRSIKRLKSLAKRK